MVDEGYLLAATVEIQPPPPGLLEMKNREKQHITTMIHEKVPYYHKENKILHERGASSYRYGHNFTDAEEAQREKVNSAIEDWLPMQKTRTPLLPTEKENKGESQNIKKIKEKARTCCYIF